MASRAWLEPDEATAVPRPRDELRVGGITRFSSVDCPGALAAVVFVQGCPWRCSYCHNPHLQLRNRRRASGTKTWSQVMAWLPARVGLIDAVVFSGGEPTLDAGLLQAVLDVRALGLSVGLHTAGIYPRRLAEVLPHVNWVGLDIKAPMSMPALYDAIAARAGASVPVRRSLQLIVHSGVPFECRTTVHPAQLSDADLVELAAGLAQCGVAQYALQIARPVQAGAAPLGPVSGACPSPTTLARLASMFEVFSVRRE